MNITEDITFDLVTFPGYQYNIAAAGNFGGGSLLVEYVINGEAAPFTGFPITAEASVTVRAPSLLIRVTLSGSTAPSIDFTSAFCSSKPDSALGDLEARVDLIGSPDTQKGNWDASTGAFPASTTKGWSYIVDAAGTVDGIDFQIDDIIKSLADDASTTTYAANWHKVDNTDQVIAVAGLTGTISKASLLSALNVADGAAPNPTLVSQAVAEAGAATAVESWSALRVAQAIAALGGGGGGYDIKIKTGGFTAVIGERYSVTADLIIFDPTSPTPAIGDFYEVTVSGGIPTIGGVQWPNNGRVIRRQKTAGGVWTSIDISVGGTPYPVDIGNYQMSAKNFYATAASFPGYGTAYLNMYDDGTDGYVDAANGLWLSGTNGYVYLYSSVAVQCWATLDMNANSVQNVAQLDYFNGGSISEVYDGVSGYDIYLYATSGRVDFGYQIAHNLAQITAGGSFLLDASIATISASTGINLDSSIIQASGIPTSAGAAGELYVDGSGFVKRA
jgi:hypothetical protein